MPGRNKSIGEIRKKYIEETNVISKKRRFALLLLKVYKIFED